MKEYLVKNRSILIRSSVILLLALLTITLILLISSTGWVRVPSYTPTVPDIIA